MKGPKLANEISATCLVSGLGHDWVTVQRECGGTTESWVECHECGMDIGELKRLEDNCKHKMRCYRCGFPLMKDRDERQKHE